MSVSFPIVVASSGVTLCMFWVLIPLAIFCLYRGYKAASNKLLLEHTPTSNCGGVSPGRVELNAEVVSDEPLSSPLTDREVVYYKYTIEEKRGGSSGDKDWEEVASGERWRHFFVHDDSGRVRVDPSDAEFHPETAVDSVVSSGHRLFERGPTPDRSARRRRVYEEHIAVDQDVYIFGAARSRQDLGIPEVHAGRPDEPYIISTTDESYMVNRYGRRANVYFWLGGLAALVLPILGTMVVGDMAFGEAIESALIPTFIIGLGVAGIMWALHRMKHGEFVADLQNRMERAESILRRECHHRERLMARIVDKARMEVEYSDRKRLDSIAEQRRQEYSKATFNNARRLCPMVDAQSEALEKVFRIIDTNESLISDDEFYELLEELTRCEKQIMMAREFYNNAVWRLREQPEAMVGDTRATRGLSFQRFETKPIDIVLPEDPEDEYGGDFVNGGRAKSADDRSTEEESSRVELDDDFLDDVEAATDAALEDEGAGEPPSPPVPEDADDKPEESRAVEVDIGDDVDIEIGNSAAVEVAGELDTGEEIAELETPDFEPKTEAFSSSMSFGNSPSMEGIGDFAEIGRFGATRGFDDLGGGGDGDDEDETAPREEFGFGRGEKAALSSKDWDPAQQLRAQKSFGFGADDRSFGFDDDEKSILETTDDDKKRDKQ